MNHNNLPVPYHKNDPFRRLEALLRDLEESLPKTSKPKKRRPTTPLPPWIPVTALLLLASVGLLMGFRNARRPQIRSITLDRLWTVKTLGPVFSTPVAVDLDHDRRSDVLVASVDGKVYGLDGPTGRRLFWFESTGPFLASLALLHTPKGPLTIAAGQDGRLYALDRQGRCVWSPIPQSFNTPAISTPVPVRLNADRIPDIVVAAEDGAVYALDGDRGWLIWKSTGTAGRFFATPLPVHANEDTIPDLVVGSPNGTLYCLDGRDGKKLWETTLPGPVSSSAVSLDRRRGIVADESGTLTVFDLTTGQHLASTKAEAPAVASPVLLGDTTTVVLPLKDGRIRAWRLPDLSPLWTFDSGSQDGFVATPAAADLNGDNHEDLVAPGRHGLCHILDGLTGKELTAPWTVGYPVAASPVLADLNGDGHLDIVLATESGDIVALTIRTMPDRLVSRGRVVAGSFAQRNQRLRHHASL